jgi:hypothetical protein
MAVRSRDRGSWGLRQALLLPAAVALLLAACAPRPALASLFGGKKAPETTMIEWLKEKGGEVGTVGVPVALCGRVPSGPTRAHGPNLAAAAPHRAGALKGSAPARPPRPRPTPNPSPVPPLPQFNVEITARAGGPRGTYATRDVPADGLLARIPMKAAIWFPAEYDSFADLGASVAREAAKGAASPYAPYLDALPMVRDPLYTVSYESWPEEYLHLIQSELMVRR